MIPAPALARSGSESSCQQLGPAVHGRLREHGLEVVLDDALREGQQVCVWRVSVPVASWWTGRVSRGLSAKQRRSRHEALREGSPAVAPSSVRTPPASSSVRRFTRVRHFSPIKVGSSDRKSGCRTDASDA
jgi:hypothetical protein